MSELKIENCPETGICSIVKNDGTKIDLMPNEADDVRSASNDVDKIKNIIADVDPSFLEKLDKSELEQITAEV